MTMSSSTIREHAEALRSGQGERARRHAQAIIDLLDNAERINRPSWDTSRGLANDAVGVAQWRVVRDSGI